MHTHKNTGIQQEEKQLTRLTLQSQAIADDTLVIRSLDWDRNRFDIEFGLRNGTTYNSFLIKGKETALIDTNHIKFEHSWFELLKENINPKVPK